MMDSNRMTENNRDMKPDMYAQVRTTKLINDVKPVGDISDVDASVFDELDERFLTLVLVCISDSVVKNPEPSFTVD